MKIQLKAIQPPELLGSAPSWYGYYYVSLRGDASGTEGTAAAVPVVKAHLYLS